MADNGTSHYFHAEANALTGKLIKPFEEPIKKQAFVKLEGKSQDLLLETEELKKLKEKKPQENYLSQNAKSYRLEGIISYSAAHTQVSGHRSKKHPDGFVTFASSSVENLNVLNVVTADRVVGQISTLHLPKQTSPEVTFLGTQFVNLRIAGHEVTPYLNHALAGTRPEGEKAIYPAKGTGLMTSVERQYHRLRKAYGEFKSKLDAGYSERLKAEDSWYSKHYHEFSEFKYDDLQKCAAAAATEDGPKWDGVTCSLVEHVEIKNIDVPVMDADFPPIIPPAKCGHIIRVPGFGTIFLAELKVNHNSFHLTMIRLELGCAVDGGGSLANCSVNGRGSSGGP